LFSRAVCHRGMASKGEPPLALYSCNDEVKNGRPFLDLHLGADQPRRLAYPVLIGLRTRPFSRSPLGGYRDRFPCRKPNLPASARSEISLVVRVIAKSGLVVAAHRNFPRAPRLKRAHEYGRGERRPNEHELLKQQPLDRPKSAKQRDQKRNWEDRRHSREALERQAQSLVASRVQNAAARFPFPVSTIAREFVNSSERRR
jgi:hypothetical protein